MSFIRRIAFLVAISGLGFLIGFLLKGPFFVDSLDGLIVGEVVKIEGIVDSERKFGNGKMLIVNDVPVFCECSETYVGLKVIISGIVERFPEDLRLRAFIVQTVD
jgi:hypothetical protein